MKYGTWIYEQSFLSMSNWCTETSTGYRLIKINDDISQPSNSSHRDKLTFVVSLLFCLHYIYSTLVIHDLTCPHLLQSFRVPTKITLVSPVILIFLTFT